MVVRVEILYFFLRFAIFHAVIPGMVVRGASSSNQKLQMLLAFITF